MPGPALAVMIPLAVTNALTYSALGSGVTSSLALVPAGLTFVEAALIGSAGGPLAIGGALAYGGLKLASLSPFLF